GVSGPDALVQEAMQRLAWMADTYLSVATPVQRALPSLLERAPSFRAELGARLQGNRATLERSLAGSAASLLASEVATHPGYFYDFAERSPHLVLSLLPPPAAFRRGAEQLRREVEHRA